MKHVLRCCSLLLISSLLSACNLANMMKMRYANDDLVANWPDKASERLLPTYYGGEKPYVDVTINGVSGFRMLIDTGASITYLADTPKVNQLNLKRGYDLSAGGWGDEGRTPIYQSELDNLSLEGISFNKVNIAVLVASTSPYYLRPDEAIFDGVLGHDILKHFTWTFDKNSNQISISNKAYSPSADDIAIPFDVFLSKLEIDGTFDMGKDQRVEGTLLIDTGSRHYVKFSQTYVDNHDIQLPGKTVTAADFGLSGRALHKRVTLPGFAMGEQKFKQVKTNLIVTEDEDDLWVIGSALLNQFVSVVDYQANTLYLRPYKNQPFRTRYNLLGLELRKIRSGEFVVRYVMPDMASASLDIAEGDLITAINGVPATAISQDKWLSLSSQPGKYEICRKRDEIICLNALSKHIDGYSINETAKIIGD